MADKSSIVFIVLHGVVELRQQQSVRINLKSLTNTWKQLSKLASDYRSTYHTLKKHHPSEMDAENFLDWMEFCVQNICHLIGNNIEKIVEMRKMSSKESIKMFEKLTIFYQKLLQSLSKEYASDDFRDHGHFIQTFEMIADVLEKSTDENLQTYLTGVLDGFKHILSSVFNSKRFSIELLSNTQHIRISIEIMKLLLTNSTHTVIDCYLNCENIFHYMMFVCIPKELARICVSADLHEEVVQVCTMLMLAYSENQIVIQSLVQELINASYTDDVHLMSILLDIWTLFLRKISAESQLMFCKLWLTASSNATPILRTPTNVLIKTLLKYTFSLLSEDHRSQIVRETNESDTSQLVALGFDSISNGEVLKCQQNAKETITRVKRTLTKLNPSTEIVSTNECMELVNDLDCFQWPPTQRLLNHLNDPELMNSLSDALLRCKTRRVNALLSIVIRMLLWEKYLCGKTLSNSMDTDYFDCGEVRKFYALELITLAKQLPDHVTVNAHSIFEGSDDLIKFRWQNSTQRTPSNTDSSTDQENISIEHAHYFDEIMKTNRTFGCTSLESCLNPSATFKRIIDQIINDSKKLKDECVYNPNIDLKQFSSDIKYACNLLNSLQNSK